MQRWAEDSGNAALMGRDCRPAEVLAADQRITAWARQLKAAGLDGDMDVLRARAYLDILLDKDSRPRQESGGQDSGGQDSGGQEAAARTGARTAAARTAAARTAAARTAREMAAPDRADPTSRAGHREPARCRPGSRGGST